MTSTKQSGLGHHFAFGGYLIGGDVQEASMHGGVGVLDVTGITQPAHSRIGGLRDGEIAVTAFMNPSAGQEHAAFSPLTRSDVLAMYLAGQVIGAPALSQNSLQLNYDPARGADGSLTEKVDCQADKFGQEWGVLLTPGPRTDTAATNGTSFDRLGGVAPAVPASGTPVTNTSPAAATVTITGGTLSNVAVNGSTAGTGDGTYTVPAGGTITLTYTVAPTWAWTVQTAFGAQAYLQAVALTGTDVTVTVQHSPDNSTWSTLMAFTEIVSGNANLPPSAQRATVSNTSTVNRYLRAITSTSGGFTSFEFIAAITVNPIAGQVF